MESGVIVKAARASGDKALELNNLLIPGDFDVEAPTKAGDFINFADCTTICYRNK